MSKPLRIGSRGSELAMWQAGHVATRLTEAHSGLDIEIVKITTKGDQITDRPLSAVGGTGLFTKEIQQALLDGLVDMAVHSLKDLPSRLPEGLSIGAVLTREDPRDALVSREGIVLADLPKGAVVATSSPRRRAQLKHRRPDFDIVDIRGNVPTRLKKLKEEGFDATILATAGLVRLGLENHITERLSSDIMLSAVGQGAIGIEIREGDSSTLNIVAPLDDPDTRVATDAERALMNTLEGGCSVPIGALGTIKGGHIILQAVVATPDGSQMVRDGMNGPAADPVTLGRSLAERMLSNGAREILSSLAETGVAL